ncbi:MAG: hypothetical protein V3W41_04230 [Planctomycetota bacterium]
MTRLFPLILIAAVFVSLGVAAEAQTTKKSAAKAASPFYGNTICPVCNNPIDKKLFAKKNGERIYVCQKAAIAKTQENWDEYYAKAYPAAKVIDAKNIKCPMMPRKAAKKRYTVTFQGHKLGVCCKKCKRKFKKQPRKWLTLALNSELVNVKNPKCLVMKDKRVKADSFVVFRGQLIGTCCDDCLDTINKNPAKFATSLKDHQSAGKRKDLPKPGKPSKGEPTTAPTSKKTGA